MHMDPVHAKHPELTVMSWNLHKGRSPAGRPAWERMKAWANRQTADVFLLQEAQERNPQKKGWRLQQQFQARQTPKIWSPQTESESKEGDGQAEVWSCQASDMAQSRQLHVALGTNVFRANARHGNAVLCTHPIVDAQRWDISAHRLERRGLLATRIEWEGVNPWVLCSHLALTRGARLRQMHWIAEWISRQDPNIPMILGGDFNDFREDAPSLFAPLGLKEAALQLNGVSLKTFPAFAPAFALDRLFVRGFEPIGLIEAGRGALWLSDHLPYMVKLRLQRSLHEHQEQEEVRTD